MSRCHHSFIATFVLVAGASVGLASCKHPSRQSTGAASASASATLATAEPGAATLALFARLPPSMPSEANPSSDAKIALGRMLYYEKRVSAGHDISCNTCHNLAAYGVDSRQKHDVSLGHHGKPGGRNSPTTYLAAGHIAQFWDGRAPTVEEQAKGPVTNPVEMAMPSGKDVVQVLTSMPEYVRAFERAFPGEPSPVTFDNFARAIGAFERKLVTRDRFDAYLAGDHRVLTSEEKEGLVAFVQTGCTTCHNGTYIGGAMFQKAGLVQPWPNQKDQGRYDVTKDESQRMVFKVPSLRNIEKTSPYFHDGSVTSLPDAVRLMASCQLGVQLDDAKTGAIVAWLGSLTGALPEEYIRKPELPPSTSKTPKALD